MADEVGSDKALIEIEVAYAKPEEQAVIAIKVRQGTTLMHAVEASGLLVRFPEIIHTDLRLGVFGVVCKPEQVVKQGDRVEIYRALIHDPKEARRQRALKK